MRRTRAGARCRSTPLFGPRGRGNRTWGRTICPERSGAERGRRRAVPCGGGAANWRIGVCPVAGSCVAGAIMYSGKPGLLLVVRIKVLL